jgi:hypothetical protein
VKTDIVSWVREQWDRCAAWLCVATGMVMLILGWVGVSDTPYTAKQIPYLASNGLGAIFLLGLAAMLWLSADLRDEWRKLDRIEGRLERIEDAVRTSDGAALADLRGETRTGSMSAPVPSPTANGSVTAHR